MKKRFRELGKHINMSFDGGNVVERRIHWWNKWKILMLSCKYPEGMGMLNLITPTPSLSLRKGDKEVRTDMLRMIEDADSVYVAIKQGEEYYLAYDVEDMGEICDLQSLEVRKDK